MLYMDKQWRNRIKIKLVNDENNLMYEFHYDYIKVKYDNNSSLLFTGTNSLMHEIKTEDF